MALVGRRSIFLSGGVGDPADSYFDCITLSFIYLQ